MVTFSEADRDKSRHINKTTMKPPIKITPQRAIQILKDKSSITITPKSLPILKKQLNKSK
jgi:predicted membrane GTPase involved in stress response